MYKTSRRVFSVVLMLALILCSFAGTASAETAEYKTTQQFIDYLDAKAIIYTYMGVDGSSERVEVSFVLDNFASAKCALFFKNDCEEVSLRIWDILVASAGKNYILSVINALNDDYKFTKFVYDESDSTVQAEMDMYIDPDHCDRCVYDAMMIMFAIIDNDEVASRLHALE